MQMQERKKPPANLMSIQVFREGDGYWASQTYNRYDWVLLRPSSRGHYRVKKKDAENISKQWKGRIMAIRPVAPHSSKFEVLIQHVYMHKELALSKNQTLGQKPNTIYPSTFKEWQSIDCITGKLTVYHTEIGSILYSDRLPSALASEGIFFYDSIYKLPTISFGYGKLHATPPPPLNCSEWPRVHDDIAGSYKVRFVCDIQNAMKPSTGSKGVHLSWLLPIACFASFFCFCTGIRKTKYTYTCKDLQREWLNSFLGSNWDTKTTHGKETVMCTINAQDIVFRYFITRQTLCMRYTYRRCRQLKGEWVQMDQDMRDEDLSDPVDITILWAGHESITTNVQSKWPVQFLRQELLLLCSDLESFYFKLNGRKVRSRRESELTCGQCALPHVLEIVQN